MHCLEQVTSKSICGNGIIEDGEECDCGGQQTCGVLEPGNCCNFSSCKLREHAFCSVSNGTSYMIIAFCLFSNSGRYTHGKRCNDIRS